MVFNGRRWDVEKQAFQIEFTVPFAMDWRRGYLWFAVDGEIISEPGTFEFLEGTKIDCVMNASELRYAELSINGINMSEFYTGSRPWHYMYEVHCQAEFSCSSEGFPGGNTAVIEITEK